MFSFKTETYYTRNAVMNDMADCVYAFHVNNSSGTQDQIDKARNTGLEVKVWGYGG
jgi:hypothetical protein